MALILSDYRINVGWVRHAAVTYQLCRETLITIGVVLLRNDWWVTQETLTHPTLRLE